MGENMNPGVAPWHQNAVEPDQAITVIERNERHFEFLRNIVALSDPTV
jgi:hypothetical protein